MYEPRRSIARRPASDLLLVGLALVLTVAAGLRFYDLGSTSIWFDEAVSWQQATLPFFRMLGATSHDAHPPLHNIILNATITLFGDSRDSTKGAVCSARRCQCLCDLQARHSSLGQITGLFAALLLALSPFHIAYSSEARTYTLLAFTATLFVLTVVRALRSPSWATLAASAAASTALLYSHTYGSFVFVAVNFFILLAFIAGATGIRVGWKSWLGAQAIAALLFVPWLLVWDAVGAHGTIRGTAGWIPKPTSQFLLLTLEKVAGNWLLLVILAGFATLSIINFAAVHSFLSKALAVPPPMTGRKTQPWLGLEWQNGILLAWLIGPLLAGYLISLSIQPILVARYLICSLPAFLLLAAAGLRSITSTSRHSNLATGVALLVIVAINILHLQYSNLTPWRNDHRTLMHEFSARYRPSDRVIFLCTYPPSQYYYRKPIYDARIDCRPSQITDDDMNVNRFWLSYPLWSHLIKEYPRLLVKAKRNHDVIYSLRSPVGRGLEMLLFQRRTAVR